MTDQADGENLNETSLVDDRALVEACLGGDSQAWEVLILRYQRLIYSIPIRSGFSPVDAADIFQSVSLKLFEKLASRRNHRKISSWLMTTTTRECWRVVEKRRRESKPSIYDEDYEQDLVNRLASEEPLADQRRIAHERQQVVREAVESLSERCRRLITLLFYSKQEPSYADIARQIKVPLNSIGSTRARCLQKLKRILEGKL
ncbi:MAG: sigma-70 family RNA polymerase sigma factor [Acidobacteriota bacterium]